MRYVMVFRWFHIRQYVALPTAAERAAGGALLDEGGLALEDVERILEARDLGLAAGLDGLSK